MIAIWDQKRKDLSLRLEESEKSGMNRVSVEIIVSELKIVDSVYFHFHFSFILFFKLRIKV